MILYAIQRIQYTDDDSEVELVYWGVIGLSHVIGLYHRFSYMYQALYHTSVSYRRSYYRDYTSTVCIISFSFILSVRVISHRLSI